MTTIVNQKARLLKVQTLTTTLILTQKQNSHSQWTSASKTASNHWAMLINVHLSKTHTLIQLFTYEQEQLGQKVGGWQNNIPTHTICLVLRLTYCVYLVTDILYFVTYILFCHWHTACILSVTYCILSPTHCVYFVADILRVFCHSAWKLHYFVRKQRVFFKDCNHDKWQGADNGLGFMDMSAASWRWTSWSNSSWHWHGNDDDNDCNEDKKANHDHYLFLKQTSHQHALIFFWGWGHIKSILYRHKHLKLALFSFFFPDSYTWHSYSSQEGSIAKWRRQNTQGQKGVGSNPGLAHNLLPLSQISR